MMILITRKVTLYCPCICIFLYEELVCITYYVVKPCTLHVCVSYLPQFVRILSITIAGVSVIMCGQLYYRIFCEFVFSSDGVGLTGCYCNMNNMLTFTMNSQSRTYACIFVYEKKKFSNIVILASAIDPLYLPYLTA